MNGAMALALLTAPLAAHHSFAGTYLEDAKPQEIKGTLRTFNVRNPHSFVHVDDESLKDKEGKPVRWVIEWEAAGQLAQQGVNTGTLKVGDTVVVTGSPGRNAEDHRLRMRSITRPSDGWKWPVGNQGFN
jgi:NADPH:quinone reductase-like Zn-dependent oxidoreductase